MNVGESFMKHCLLGACMSLLSLATILAHDPKESSQTDDNNNAHKQLLSELAGEKNECTKIAQLIKQVDSLYYDALSNTTDYRRALQSLHIPLISKIYGSKMQEEQKQKPVTANPLLKKLIESRKKFYEEAR